MSRLHIPMAWRQSADTILAERPRVILVIGGGDSGKSSYCRFLAGALLASGERVAIVDADIGQKTVGPPATVTLGYVVSADPWVCPPVAFYFVGATNPMGRMLPLVIGTARLASAADAPFVIVDTTGFVEGAGRVLKSYKIEAVRPDLIVAIERHDALEPILRAHRTFRTIRIRPSRKARPRDRRERDEARSHAFAAYFREAPRLELCIDDVVFQRSLLFNGVALTLAGTLYAETTPEGVIAVAEAAPPGVKVVKVVRPGFDHNLLCGVADGRNCGVGLAILDRIDFGRRTVSLLSPVPGEQVRALQLGDLYIGPDGRELGRVGPGGL
jgi:polynucleotide 5'-hydroxyl-kinase GRC3/NOL9